MTVTLQEAQSNFAALAQRAAQGEEIVVVQDETPLAKIVAHEAVMRPPRGFGSAKGTVWMAPDFEEPLEDFKEYLE